MAQAVPGPVTGVDLRLTEALLCPWMADPWGRLRPPVSLTALQMSAELSAACQSLNVTPWLRAGWRDVTVQVDGELAPLEREWRSLAAKLQRSMLRAKMRGVNPLTQLTGMLREREAASTGKAVVMLRPAQGGRYVVAICFMGTGTRFYDWFSNFRISTPEGIHEGFSQLTDQFEGNEAHIEFPETAREMGLERLTLAHILQEARSPHSRFLIWLSGHSQGGAVMQVYARRKLLEDGVYPQNLLGWGFASPSVATGQAAENPEGYPLYHVHNSDDLVPRCGAAVHLGVCLVYPADEALRRACYGWPRDEASVQARLAVRPLVRQMVDTPGCIVQLAALLTVLQQCPAKEIAQALGVEDSPPATKLLERFDLRALLAGLLRRMQAAYLSVTGQALPQEKLEASVTLTREILRQTGMKAFAGAMGQLLRYPHRMSARENGDFATPYTWIARHGAAQLKPYIWQSGPSPWRMAAPMEKNP